MQFPPFMKIKKILCKNVSLIFDLYESMGFSVNLAFQSDIRCSYNWSFSSKLPKILVTCVGSYQRSELSSQTCNLENEIGFLSLFTDGLV